MKVFQVRWLGSNVGHSYVVENAEQALEQHRAFFAGTVKEQNSYVGRTVVEHTQDMIHYCSACHFYPCTYQGQ